MPTSTARHSKEKKHCINLFEHDLTYMLLDTETTGKEKDAYIVELAVNKYVVKNGHVTKVESLDLYIKPPFMMSPDIIALHGITNEQLKNEPEEKELIDQIKTFFSGQFVIVGYNVDFDIEKIEHMYRRCGQTFSYAAKVDVLDFVRDLLYGQTESFTLGEVTSYLGLNEGIQYHNAAGDIEATQRLLRYCYAEYKDRLDKPHNEQLYVNFFYYWKGHNKAQAGLWVNTNQGKLYFSTYYKRWFSNEINLDLINIDALEQYILTSLNISYRDLERITEKRFKELKTK